MTTQVRCPLCAAEYGLNEAIANPPPTLIPLGAAPAEDLENGARPDAGESPEMGDQIRPTTEQEPSADDPERPALMDDDALPEPIAEASPFSERICVTRLRRRPRSGLQTILEIVTGGLAGTLFAYYALAWWQGPAFELPRFGLPFVDRLTAAPAKPGEAAGKSSEASEPKPADRSSGPTAAASVFSEHAESAQPGRSFEPSGVGNLGH